LQVHGWHGEGHAVRIEKLREEVTKSGYGDSADVELLKLFRPAVTIINEHGQFRMDNVIEELFNET